jgi:DNA-binding beta-propeller fold protein YncE
MKVNKKQVSQQKSMYLSENGVLMGTEDGQFNGPTDIAVDSLGNVYVADSNNNRIQKFNGNGNFITKWGSLGAGDGEFDGPVGIAIDSSGNVYVADIDNGLIPEV